MAQQRDPGWLWVVSWSIVEINSLESAPSLLRFPLLILNLNISAQTLIGIPLDADFPDPPVLRWEGKGIFRVEAWSVQAILLWTDPRLPTLHFSQDLALFCS